MNRNQESHFAQTPSANIKRSLFDRSCDKKLTFNAGLLVPFYVDEVLPGDTFNVDIGATIRMTPQVHATMDNAYIDTYFFFVPNRLVWSHWQEFCGEDTTDAWTNPTEYTIPQILFNSDQRVPVVGCLADYLGLPLGVQQSVNALPFRAYCKIFNDWFRDENVMSTAQYLTGDADVQGALVNSPASYIQGATVGGRLCPVAKFHDYFTSALPSAQKGPQVSLFPASAIRDSRVIQPASFSFDSSGNPTAMGVLPLAFSGTDLSRLDYQHALAYGNNSNSSTTASYNNLNPLAFKLTQTGASNQFTPMAGMNLATSSSDYTLSTANAWNGSVSGNSFLFGSGIRSNIDIDKYGIAQNRGPINSSEFTPTEAYPYSTNTDFFARFDGIDFTINQFRMSYAIQLFRERMALGGSRYIEILQSMFGVKSPDARLQRAEYLGGGRISINSQQVLQTSSTDSTSPQGNVSGMVLKNVRQNGFRKSFVEHGYVIGVLCARTDHTYQQGIDPLFQKKTKFDIYWPVFANIGNQPLKNKTLYATGTSTDDEVFGYQEAWAEYRYKSSTVSGMFRSGISNTLDSWHYADYYTSLPTLTSSWMIETTANIDRTLAVQSSVADQFLADIYIKNYCYRAMPVYSIPMLGDHN